MVIRRALVAAAASALLLAGCASGPVTPPTVPLPSDALPTTPAPPAAPTGAPVAGATTCETLIAAGTVAEFERLGWTSQEEPFMVGATAVDGGLMCKWGDPDGSGEGLQIFGWAPIDSRAAEAARSELLANGWRTIDTDEGSYVTESLDTAFATGAQGYGLTYQFGEDWVIFADTKQSLLLIDRPQT